MTFETLQVQWQDTLCTARIHRPAANNAINARLIEELAAVLSACSDPARTPPVSILVLEGSPEVFCSGGDLEAISASSEAPPPEPLFDLWARMAASPLLTISVVRGRVNAGGLGFLCASDIVLADRTAVFSLSELLFGIFPALVLPFLIRRTGRQKAHYLTLMTRPITAEEALSAGLIDALEDDVGVLLRKHLLRLRRLQRSAIGRYKAYLSSLDNSLELARPLALAANREFFSDPSVQNNIRRYVTESKFPWEP
ncbi:MAG TPA: enoyl-CoA hydratase/isomerase [Bryobacteraceae bacterium]|nr:enoyl-CoA hydratase/isomerase [Bryobacteraceae bacterium]